MNYFLIHPKFKTCFLINLNNEIFLWLRKCLSFHLENNLNIFKINQFLMNKVFCHILLILFYLVASPLLHAKDAYEDQFNQGKQLYINTKYAEAMTKLMPLTKEAKGNRYVETAQYYYALAAFKDKKMQDAYYMLLQLTQKYSKWNNIEEAYYLAGAVSFELKKYRYALNFLKDRNSKLQSDIADMKAYYLNKVQPIDTLIAIQKSYSQDADIAKTLALRLELSKPLAEKQAMLLQYLIQEYKLNVSQATTGNIGQIKNTYNVAALFPFLVNINDFENYSKNNSYINELYLGMAMAVDSLKKEGIGINLYAYDTEKDNSKLTTLLQKSELKNADVIFGPLLPNQNAPVGAYALQNGVYVVNPLSHNSKLADKNNYVILFQPTLEAQAGEAANMVKKQWVTKDKNKVAIFFGDSARDSLFAVYYRDSLIAQKIQVPLFEKIKKDKLFRLSNALSDSNKLKGYTHVCVLSADEIVAATVISALEKSMNAIPVIARADWLQLPTLNLEQLQKRNIHFIYPEYINYADAVVDNFKRQYTLKYHALPSQYVYMGFDMMYYIGHVMKDFGTDLKQGLTKTTAHKGVFLPGLNFTNSYTNRYTPIVKFEDMKLKIVNARE